ncbi:RagB/SusD family nutrient uptake outer membrane protein [Aequorivita echinoideorum]|uniref:RagB/SusD family nutrient uptake outer membrane protein n=1 Tax=Aequorivita echinoideorum TaxID=1549647 RepID=A0ABS5S0V0_9FLAO|nr:RagB/SusD family nutrient uptake outer membrane protein [Aequorivita echinoideorum]MBT0606603.1 RagB/SusD family nutrient uptake outer membrane protein [Aequorivita echinoideorum]
MKKIFYNTALLLISIGVLSSCESELDQVPFDEAPQDQVYQTIDDFENATLGIYETLTLPTLYGGSDAGGMLDAPDVLSDNVTFAQRGRGTRFTLHNFLYFPADEVLGGLYARSYEMIYRANLMLSYAEQFQGDPEDISNFVAEAKALRALGHLNVVSFFGKIPTQSSDANGSLGIAYVTSPDFELLPARETVGDVYNKIVADLTEALADINPDNGVARFDTEVVALLLSRTYLYMGQWQNAIDAADMVTSSIAPRDEVNDVWIDESRAGLLFYIPNTQDGLGVTQGVTWSQGGRFALIPEYVVSLELYQLYQNDDIRKMAYTLNASNGQLQFNAIKKAFGRTVGITGQVDFKLFRVAEANLNKAEAYYNLGNESSARTELDIVRTNRYTSPPSGETGVALRDAIRLERRLEFAFESQRFFDIKRWGLPVSREAFGDLADGSGTPSVTLSLPAGNFRFQLPIPQSTIDKNPNLVQNPGY